MLITLIRTIIMYMVVVGVLRIMGKRQIGELEASELVVTIIISDIAAMPITNTEVPLVSNVIAIFILMILEIIVSFFAFKNPRFRGIIYGKPSTFFQKGKFCQDEMLRQRFNVADVMEEIRGCGICNLSDVAFVIMETNGKVSVIPKTEKDAVTPEQMEIKTEPVKMSYIIVDNGVVIKGCMKKLGLNKEWLDNCVKEHGLKSVKEVFYLSFEEESGSVVLVPFDEEV